MALPDTMKAIILVSYGSTTLTSRPFPSPTPGSITIRVLHILISSHASNLVNNAAGMTKPLPMIPGSYFVGRVAAIGPDTTSFEAGQLVLVDPFVRARDDTLGVRISHGAFDGVGERSKKFTKENWRDGAYMRAPLENAWALNEEKMLGNLGRRTWSPFAFATSPTEDPEPSTSKPARRSSLLPLRVSSAAQPSASRQPWE